MREKSIKAMIVASWLLVGLSVSPIATGQTMILAGVALVATYIFAFFKLGSVGDISPKEMKELELKILSKMEMLDLTSAKILQDAMAATTKASRAVAELREERTNDRILG